jgi:hypothetical protein
VLGLVAWAILSAREQETLSIFSPTATAEMPLNSISLPQSKYDGISVTLVPTMFEWRIGWILTAIDDKSSIQTVNEKDLIYTGAYSKDQNSSLYTFVNFGATISVMLVGKSDDEPSIVENRIPIRIVSYRPIAEWKNVMGTCMGGGNDYYVMKVGISDESINSQDHIVWATYPEPQQVREIITQYSNTSNDSMQELPSELVNFLNTQQETLPDYFSLIKNEVIGIKILINFENPGIYELQFGAQYIYKGSQAIAWVEQPIKVNVIGDYNFWSCWHGNDGDQITLLSTCKLVLENNSYKYQCEAPK